MKICPFVVSAILPGNLWWCRSRQTPLNHHSIWVKISLGKNQERMQAQDSDRASEFPTSWLPGDKNSNCGSLQNQPTHLAASTPVQSLKKSETQQAPALAGTEESHLWRARTQPNKVAGWEKQRRRAGSEGRRSQGHQADGYARARGCKRQRLKTKDEEAIKCIRNSRQKGPALQSLPPAHALGPSGYCQAPCPPTYHAWNVQVPYLAFLVMQNTNFFLCFLAQFMTFLQLLPCQDIGHKDILNGFSWW